jgi:anti-sigma-K factor RskA
MKKTRDFTEDDDLRLAEYALGVLEADERRSVEAQLAVEPEYSERLVQWHARLAPMLEEIADQAPPEYVWARIRDSLGHNPHRAAAPEASGRRSVWESLNLWRWFSAGSIAAAMVMALVLVVVLPREADLLPIESTLTTALQLENGQVVYTATLNASRRSLVVVPAAEIQLEGRDAQLWLIAGDLPPQSLGLLPADGAVRLAVPEELIALASVDSVFAISLEPPGGSPTGLPTGPVVAQGVLADI